MNIEEIYNKFNNIGCLTFATIDEGNKPVTRIAHLRGFDNEGIYFMTMITKGFYKELVNSKTVSICGLSNSGKVNHDKEGMPIFESGYSINMTGHVEEISIEEIINKNNPIFDLCIKDNNKYKAMRVFCITKARGEIFDYDFEKINKDHKLDRIYFSYNGESIKEKGLIINQSNCIKCGLCKNKCSFNAIDNVNNTFFININRCDECGDCFINCPVRAINRRD